MNETKMNTNQASIYKAGTPQVPLLEQVKVNAERVLNNLPLLMFGLLMFATLALDMI